MAALSAAEQEVLTALQDAGVRRLERFRGFLAGLHTAYYRTVDDFKQATRVGVGLATVLPAALVDSVMACQEGDESTSGREKAAGGVVYVQVILRQAGQPVKVQLASEEEAEAAAPLNGSEVARVSELTLQTLKVPPPPATSAVYVDPGGNSLPVHIRLPATEQEYLALPPQLISDNSRDKPLRLIVCKSGSAMGMVRDIQSAIAAVVQDFTAGMKGMFVAVNNTHPKRD